MAEEQDNPGGWLPPPLTYLLTLVLGLVLDRSLHLPFLPHRVARVLGWPLVGGGIALATWFIRTMRAADTTLDINKPVSRVVQDGPFRYSRNPGYLSGDDLHRASHSSERSMGHPFVAVAGGCDPEGANRARGTLSGTHLRRGVPGLQAQGSPLGVAT